MPVSPKDVRQGLRSEARGGAVGVQAQGKRAARALSRGTTQRERGVRSEDGGSDEGATKNARRKSREDSRITLAVSAHRAFIATY